MTKKLSTIWLILLAFCSFSQENNLNVFFYSSAFNMPQNGPYLETYITVVGESVTFIKSDDPGFLNATVEVTMLFRPNKEIVDFRKYNLVSPKVVDSSEIRPNFIDLQRIPLKAGIYSYELIIRDINNSTSVPFIYNDILSLDFDDSTLNISGIELVESYEESKKENIYSKNGYDIIPYVSDFYPSTVENLAFYAEVYNMDRVLGNDIPFLIKYYIEGFNTNIPIHEFSHFEKQISSPVNVVFKDLNIAELPSGNFNLVIEIRDKENNLLTNKKMFFQRSNPGKEFNLNDLSAIDVSKSFVLQITNIDTLREYIHGLRPISDKRERLFADNQLETNNIDLMQQFFLSFWQKRNQSRPEIEWKNYQKQVDFVNKWYSTQIMKGYETDRGRVYLQYGTPNTITDKKYEAGYYPYEIWHYYQTQGQTNRKFVFYKPGLGVNDYQLIHSNANGEIVNEKWGELIQIGTGTPSFQEDIKQRGGVYDDFDLVR